MSKHDLADFHEAVHWLSGQEAGGLTLKMVAEAMHLDITRLYRAPHELVVREMRARKSGRRRREDYQ